MALPQPPKRDTKVHIGALEVRVFLVNVNPNPGRPLDWYPWEAKDLKELKKAVAEDGPNSPWTTTLLQDIAYHPCVPKDWMDAASAVLPNPTFLRWTALFREECRKQGEANAAANPPIPVTWGMLVGTQAGYTMGIQQAQVAVPQYREQVRDCGLRAWSKLDTRPTEGPMIGMRQKPTEDLPSFIDRVEQSLKRKLPPGEIRDQFIKLTVWEGMNGDHK